MGVDNVVASNYIAVQEHANEFVEIGGVAIPMTQSFGIHLMLTPLRLWCGSGKAGMYCNYYTDDGYHVYTKFFLELGKWIDQQGVFVQLSALLIATVGLFFVCVGVVLAK